MKTQHGKRQYMKSHTQRLQHNKIRTEINPPKTRGYTALNIKELKTVPTQCMAAFSTDLSTNSHYIPHTAWLLVLSTKTVISAGYKLHLSTQFRLILARKCPFHGSVGWSPAPHHESTGSIPSQVNKVAARHVFPRVLLSSAINSTAPTVRTQLHL
jgi:hypothetical protein